MKEGKIGVLVVAILSVMVTLPAFGAVTSLSTDRETYTIDDKITFIGNEDIGKQIVNVVVKNPGGATVILRSGIADTDGSFELVPINAEDIFSSSGTYTATAFTNDQPVQNGTTIRITYENGNISLIPDKVLELNPVSDKTVNEGSELLFSVSATDSDFKNLNYSLAKNPPTGAKIDSKGVFSWTPTSTQGPATYIFDIVVSDGIQEDSESITITVKEVNGKDSEQTPKSDDKTENEQIEAFLVWVDPKEDPQSYIDRYNSDSDYKKWFDSSFPDITIEEALDVKEPEPDPEPKKETKSELAPFVDPKQDPQYYIDRYNNEPSYKAWFDENYSDWTIYEAVGLEEPKPKKETPAFVDPNLDPQYYIDRYNNEPSYKDWFDSNFPDMTIYEAVGVTEPEEGFCGAGTVLKDGVCTIVITSQPSSGGGCLIATATYGSELAPQVQMLREIRDNSILQTESGATFMTGFNHLYYMFSPTIADWERQNPVFKEVVKVTITPMLATLSILNYFDIDSEQEILGYGLGIIFLNIGMYFVAPFMIIRKSSRFFKQD